MYRCVEFVVLCCWFFATGLLMWSLAGVVWNWV